MWITRESCSGHRSIIEKSNYQLLITTYQLRMSLNWESTYAIALELRRQHPNVNLDDITLGQIYKWTLQLPEFEDDPSLANDDILYAIYQDWFEENIHGQ